MDIVFKCPNCDQELEVDAAGAGSAIECPSCSRTITVPQSETQNGESAEQARTQTATAPGPAKIERHFTVPEHAGPTEALIQKANKPLEVAAKEGDRKVRVKTFKRTDCQEVGKDKFDETVSGFLDRVGWANIISVTPINYSYVQLDTHACVTDYGVLIVYRG